MVKLYTKMIVKEKYEKKFIEVSRELIKKSREEQGNIYFNLNQNDANKQMFLFMEAWENKEYLNRHNECEHLTKTLPVLLDMAEKVYPIELYVEL